MTWRAVILGILLGLFIATFTYLNDQVIRQTLLIGNHLPAIVFGIGLLLILLVNPLLRLVGDAVGDAGTDRAGMTAGDRLMIKPAELAIILALGLAVCAWPGSNLLRYFSQLMALPVYRAQMQASWQATGVMSYVPGQSPLLARGYIRDFDALTAALLHPAEDPVLAATVKRLPPTAAQVLERARQRRLSLSEQNLLVRGLNEVIAGPPLPTIEPGHPSHLLQHGNRQALEGALPMLRSMPEGSGVLLQAYGREDEVIGPLITGDPQDRLWARVPWDAWWPSLRLWGGGLLFAGLATLCLMVIVHPQWAHRELLRYPTVEFVHEATRWSPGRFLPHIASSRLFWMGLLPVAGIHLLNGMQLYVEDLPAIERQLNFAGLRQLFPNAGRVTGNAYLFMPMIIPSVIGFGYFVTARASLSIGLSLVLWIAMGSWLMTMGASIDNSRMAFGAVGPALRFGAYVAMALMILYFGRLYYADVVRGAVGLRPRRPTPAYAVWSARLGSLFTALSAYFLVAYASLSPLIAVLFVLTFLMMMLVLARINAEAGLFYAQPDWIPGVALAGLLGTHGVGAEGLVVVMIASQVFAADPREALSPYLINGLRLADRLRFIVPGRPGDEGPPAATPGRLAPLMGGMIVVGLVVATCVTLHLQYGQGFPFDDRYATDMPPNTIHRTLAEIQHLDGRGELSGVTRLTGLGHLTNMRPDGTFVRYAAIGFVLLLACAIARIRIPWWPLHPVIFLVWGTLPANLMAFSFLLAWLVKVTVVRIGGAKAYDDAKPLMVGLIAGDVLMIIVWAILGACYYLITGMTPAAYRILPV